MVPQILWPLLMYEVPISREPGEKDEPLTGKVELGFSKRDLYSTGSKMQPPIKAMIEEYKTAKVRTMMVLRDSQDHKKR